MSAQLYISFVVTSLIFGLIPGPSVCFTIAYALRHGGRRTVPTILGQAAANALQLLIIVCGLSGILAQSAAVMSTLRIGGACYLVYLGARTFFASDPQLERTGERTARGLYRSALDGFIVCGTNPKALLYYAALLPQFIAPRGDRGSQLVLLGISSVIIGTVILSFYTLLAGHARYWLLERGLWRVQKRASGVLIVTAGAALGLSGSGAEAQP
ncbi:MAG: LysE family translocator [Phycisphaerales bacterium]|nr:MAG: LysE family translocator [Phycisphaerales bacterium]